MTIRSLQERIEWWKYQEKQRIKANLKKLMQEIEEKYD